MSQPQNNQLQIKVDDAVLRGAYANGMQVQHTKEEFVLDFLNVFPPTGTLQARIVVSPAHLKRIVAALAENLAKYETNFGKIEAAEGPGEIGFKA
jgi:hypothetical protein